MITAEGLAARLDGLADIGVGPEGVYRLAWTEEDAATRAWFERQADETGLRFERDPAGNLWACPDADPPWWGIGSHLDSVRGGGRFDGPLGVACGFEIAGQAVKPGPGVDQPVGIDAGHAHRVAQRHAVVVAAIEHGGQVEPPGQRLAPE